ncbi:zinc finger HIT domain-containing protein 3 [Polistes fuscatus]|uniref:zinc finger HIT domain-containing protein 3 n=1 Tax=Polistes fuscatus TaxID=30207 RepID=UPI001CAA3F05|nr:zinc finger HIT domain-containing protein 3 [Polistes fuscatus]XP_043485604.1 zinc finger HIT domain-containing protein 3 [Polistes fuscatus]
MNKICSICEKDLAKYKCPTCRTPFCSVTCGKEHKKADCKPSSPTPPPPSSLLSPSSPETKSEEDAEKDIVPLEILQKLSQNQEVKNCLKNPQVRDIVTFIANNEDPMEAINLAMTESVFVELADACLKVVEEKEWEDK